MQENRWPEARQGFATLQENIQKWLRDKGEGKVPMLLIRKHKWIHGVSSVWTAKEEWSRGSPESVLLMGMWVNMAVMENSMEAPQKTENRTTTTWSGGLQRKWSPSAERFLRWNAECSNESHETGARCPSADERNVGCALWSPTSPGEERLPLAIWLWASITTGQSGRLC